MSFEISMGLTMKPWMKNPGLRIDEGFRRAGFNFRQGLSRSQYPPIPANSRYVRTGLTADKANFNITVPGKEMEFGSTYYLPFLLFDGAKHRALWPQKRDQLVRVMIAGFKSGVKEYKGE